MKFRESFPKEERDFGALEDVGAFAGIEIENEVRGRVDLWNAMEEGMKFKRGGVGGPGERGRVVDQDVLDRRFVRMASRNGKRFDPIGREGGKVFFVKGFAEDAIRKTFESDWTIAQMRENRWSDLDVVIDDAGFDEFAGWVENLVGARNGDLFASNFDCCFPGHRIP